MGPISENNRVITLLRCHSFAAKNCRNGTTFLKLPAVICLSTLQLPSTACRNSASSESISKRPYRRMIAVFKFFCMEPQVSLSRFPETISLTKTRTKTKLYLCYKVPEYVQDPGRPASIPGSVEMAFKAEAACPFSNIGNVEWFGQDFHSGS